MNICKDLKQTRQNESNVRALQRDTVGASHKRMPVD